MEVDATLRGLEYARVTPHTPSSRSRSGFEDTAPRVDCGLCAVLELDLAGALGLVPKMRRRAPLWAGAVGELRQLRADGLCPAEAWNHLREIQNYGKSHPQRLDKN